MSSIRSEAIQAHMSFLADDLLEGRETGSRGYLVAANYVASQLQLLGLEPAGGDGTFFQWVDVRKTELVEEGCEITLVTGGGERELTYAEHYLMWGDPNHEFTEVDAPLVYVGHGVSAPEVGYDDFAGIDVRGKIIVRLRGAPPTFPHNERAYFSSSRVKNKAASDRGAVGILQFLTPKDAARRPWKKSVLNSKIASMRWLDPDGKPHGVFPEIKISAYLSPEGVEAVFDGASSSLEEVLAAADGGKPHSFDLSKSARATRRSRHSEARSPNVMAVLRGSDPSVRDEVLVYTAHLDHLGVGEPLNGDRIYNGAYDNASGCAVLIEVARAFAGLPRSPRRSIMFMAVTGEEKGLQGSEYFTEYPTIPMENIIGNINLDMFLMLHPLNDLIAFGAEHSDLSGNVEDAARKLGIKTTPDPMPEEVIFVRSDQYNFVKKGVPAVFLVGGEDVGGVLPPGSVDDETWIRDYYHTQIDDMSQYIDFGAGVKFSQANLLIGYDVANQENRPKWNDGDFFGEKFGKLLGTPE
jgi:hypothetical protein